MIIKIFIKMDRQLWTIEENYEIFFMIFFNSGRFFLWGYIKEKIYAIKPIAIQQPKQNIRREIYQIT